MSPSASSSACLEVLQGPLVGQILPLTHPETVVGRETGGGLSLPSYREVSRRHARFYLQDNVWCVQDLGSTNGTFVNGTRATPSFSLNNGSLVQLGDFQARFRENFANSIAGVPGATQFSPQLPLPNPQMPSPTMPMPPGAPLPPGTLQPRVIPYPVITPYPVAYPPTAPKNPGVALLCSLILVGGGQFYNGQIEKGAIMLVSASACGILGLFTCGLTWLAPPLIWILSIVDAYQSAERINRETTGRPY